MVGLTILGCGMPTPAADRFGTSFVVCVDGEYLMFDCGPATTHKLAKAGLSPTDVQSLFFTHHHFDHDVDYPCFLLTRWDQAVEQTPELVVYGPEKTELITTRLIGEDGAFAFDVSARINHPVSQEVYRRRGGTLPRKPPATRVREVRSGTVVENGSWKVTAATADHAQPYLDCLAYRLDTDQASIVFMGDSVPCDSVLELAREVDILLCEVWDDLESDDPRGRHAGALRAGGFAAAVGAKTLVLVHLGAKVARHGSMERVVGDIREVYDGGVIVGSELMAIDGRTRSPV